MKSMEPISFLGDFIDGDFVNSGRNDGQWVNTSPGNTDETVCEVGYQFDRVEQACEAAQRAFVEWSEHPMEHRMEMLKKVQSMFSKNQEKLAELISRETGKPLWETMGEAKAMVGKFTITFDHSLKLIAEQRLEGALPSVDGVVRYRPRGVFAVLGPFNFPGHLPNGHIVPALVTGNTVVFKPSELTPMTGQFIAECFKEANIPRGVFNMIQGPGETGRRLVCSKKIDGVLFTGSYETGLRIKEATLHDYWKIHALEMGGKNSTLIWDDADMDKAIYESVIGSFMSAGQRCSCTSRIFVHKNSVDKFVDKFYQQAKKLEIGHWSTNPFMGSLINEKSVDNYIRFQDIAVREGAEKIMRGKSIEPDVKGHYVTPSIYRVGSYDSKSVYQNTEIFGPNVAIYEMTDIDEAIKVNNTTGYGLAMAIFTKNKDIYSRIVNRAKVGVLNWNRTTNGASSRLPFGGCGKSGNDRPTAHFAVYYCTRAVASLEDPTAFDPNNTLPGMHWQ